MNTEGKTKGTNIIPLNKSKGKRRKPPGSFTNIKPKPVFATTKNVRNFEVMMDFFNIWHDEKEVEGIMGIVYSRAGRGKTRTAQWYAAHNNCIYIRMESIWSTTYLGFLHALCRELEIVSPPCRKTKCFYSIIDALLAKKRPVFLDEVEKLPKTYLEIIRDITDITGAPFVLIGEEELVPYLQQNRRIWSRCYYKLKFDPLTIADITLYFHDAIEIDLPFQIASMFHIASEGDFRLVRRYLVALTQIINATETKTVTEEMAKISIDTGLKG